jgi:hypothetical protein
MLLQSLVQAFLSLAVFNDSKSLPALQVRPGQYGHSIVPTRPMLMHVVGAVGDGMHPLDAGKQMVELSVSPAYIVPGLHAEGSPTTGCPAVEGWGHNVWICT